METGHDLWIVHYSQNGFGLRHEQCTGSTAWEIYRLRIEAASLSFSDLQLGQFFPISPHPDDVKFPSISHPLMEI